MFDRCTDRARRVLVLSQEEARLLGHNFIGTEHLLLCLICEDEGVAAGALRALGVDLEAARSKVAEVYCDDDPGHATTGSPPFTPRAKKVLELSLREALQLGHNYIGTEHMLLGIVREGGGVGAQVLVGMGADLSKVRQKVIQLLTGYPPEPTPAPPAPKWRRWSNPLLPPVVSCLECGALVCADSPDTRGLHERWHAWAAGEDGGEVATG